MTYSEVKAIYQYWKNLQLNDSPYVEKHMIREIVRLTDTNASLNASVQGLCERYLTHIKLQDSIIETLKIENEGLESVAAFDKTCIKILRDREKLAIEKILHLERQAWIVEPLVDNARNRDIVTKSQINVVLIIAAAAAFVISYAAILEVIVH